MTRAKSPVGGMIPRLGPASWVALAAVPTIVLVALIATSPSTLCSTLHREVSGLAAQEKGAHCDAAARSVT